MKENIKFDFSNEGISFKFDVDADGFVVWRNLSFSNIEHKYMPSKWAPMVEMHVAGENPNDHHMAKHTGGSATFTLKHKEHRYYENVQLRRQTREEYADSLKKGHR